MHAVPLIAVLALGVDVGWRPLPDGGLEYIIQVEPELLEALRRGQPLASDVPPVLRNIRRYRIQVGNGPLPQEGPLDVPMPGEEEPTPARRRSAPSRAAARGQASGRPDPRLRDQAGAKAPSSRESPVAAPAARQAAEHAQPPAEADAGKVADVSASETAEAFAEPAAAPQASAEPDGARPPPGDNEGPLLAAQAPPERDASASAADVPPRLAQNEAAGELVHGDAPRGSQPTTVHKVAGGGPAEEPPLRGGAAAGELGSQSASEAAPPGEPNKPWVWLTLSLMGLAASLAVNVYQGLVHFGLRAKYRQVVRRLHDVTAGHEELTEVDCGWPDEQAAVETVRAEGEEEDHEEEA